jgi:hypothetical protein
MTRVGDAIRSFHKDVFEEKGFSKQVLVKGKGESVAHLERGTNRTRVTLVAVGAIAFLVAFVAACMLIHHANAKLYTNGMTYKAHVVKHAQMVAAAGAGVLALIFASVLFSKAFVRSSEAIDRKMVQRAERRPPEVDEVDGEEVAVEGGKGRRWFRKKDQSQQRQRDTREIRSNENNGAPRNNNSRGHDERSVETDFRGSDSGAY